MNTINNDYNSILSVNEIIIHNIQYVSVQYVIYVFNESKSNKNNIDI